MTFEARPFSFLLVLLCIGLGTGCGGSGSGSSEPGIEAGFSASNSRSARNAQVPAAEAGQTFYTDAGKRIDLENGFLSIAPLGLVACPTVTATLGRWLGNFLLSSAWAHGSGVEAPAGVMDVAEAEDTVLALGHLPATPGRYCSIELELARLPASAPGANEGALLYVAPCYYPDSGTIPDVPGLPTQPDEVNHSCYQIPVPGPESILRLQLPAPLVLDSSRRRASIRLRVEYDTWFDGVDVEALAAGDAAQRQKLVDRVAASMQLGEVDLH